MIKLTPFRDVICPICGTRINTREEGSPLVNHIRHDHPAASIKLLVQELFQQLKFSLPENINEVNDEELYDLLANLCLYKSTKLGLKRLRRKKRGE